MHNYNQHFINYFLIFRRKVLSKNRLFNIFSYVLNIFPNIVINNAFDNF
jgi:hypothetical protein